MRGGPHRKAARVAWALVALLLGCGDADTGVVEMSWVFVDRDGQPIFPAGVFSIDAHRDSCSLPGQRGRQPLAYSLHVELEICDPLCEGGCGDPQCHVVPREAFSCKRARTTDPEVPAGAEPYRFTVRPILVPEDEELGCRPEPGCVAVPGPRERRVQRGLVTDLHVYQVVLDVDVDGQSRLDLDACGCG